MDNVNRVSGRDEEVHLLDFPLKRQKRCDLCFFRLRRDSAPITPIIPINPKCLDEDGREAVLEFGGREAGGETAAMGNGDVAGLLRDDNGKGIGGLRNAEG